MKLVEFKAIYSNYTYSFKIEHGCHMLGDNQNFTGYALWVLPYLLHNREIDVLVSTIRFKKRCRLNLIKVC